MKKIKNILVTNDDGYNSPGINALAMSLCRIGKVTVIAPDKERSAIGHALTFFRPLRMHRIENTDGIDRYVVNGTPTDCMILGIYYLLRKKPDLIASGINRGANLGNDVTYSGTVSGAIEGAIHGIPSMAVSLACREEGDFTFAADFAASVAEYLMKTSLPEGVFLNINVPSVPANQIRGISITYQGRSRYHHNVLKRVDPRGYEYFWITGEIPEGDGEYGSDFNAVIQNRISVTPMHLSLTREDFIEKLKKWDVFNSNKLEGKS